MSPETLAASAGGPIMSRLAVRFALKKALPQADAANAPKILAVDDAHEALAGVCHHHLFVRAGAGAPTGNLLAQLLAFLTSPAGQALIAEILKMFGL